MKCPIVVVKHQKVLNIKISSGPGLREEESPRNDNTFESKYLYFNGLSATLPRKNKIVDGDQVSKPITIFEMITVIFFVSQSALILQYECHRLM